MSAMVTGFEGVPELPSEFDGSAIKDETLRGLAAQTVQSQAQGLYADLRRLGLSPPATENTVKRDELIAFLRDVGGAWLAAELRWDRAKVYDSLSAEQVARVLFYINPTVFAGLPYAPNAVTGEDIAAVRA